MSRLVLLHPTSLLGKELIERLDQRPELWKDLALLSLDEDEIGALTDAAGAAAVVQGAEPSAIADADVLVVCGAEALYRDLVSGRGADSTVLLLDPLADDPAAVPIVAGINSEQALAGRVLASPHPGTVLLAHLLAPLLPFEIADVTATLVQPASLFGRAGLDELFAQAGRLIALQGQEESEIFGGQLAFNLYPAPHPPGGFADPVRRVLGVGEAEALPLAAHLLQGGVFHGISALLHLRTGKVPVAEEVRRALAANPAIELREDGAGKLGPIDAAADESVLVGTVEQDPEGGVWIWAVMDNLTRGGAANALGILEHILTAKVH
jgi:aspartate-semialdehyde dehydrogenase